MNKFIRDMLGTDEAHAIRSFLDSRPEQRAKRALLAFIDDRADLRADKAVRAQQAVVRKLQELGAPELAASLGGAFVQGAVCSAADLHITLPLAVASRLLPLPVRMVVLLGVTAVDSAISTTAQFKCLDKAEFLAPRRDEYMYDPATN